jgi:hypothetical protein
MTPPAAITGEPALCLARVGHEAGETPDREDERGLCDVANQPEHCVDPGRAGLEPSSATERGHNNHGRNEEKRPRSSRALQESCETESRREHRRPDQGIHERELSDAVPRKEQSVDGALRDHDSCIREERDPHEDGDRSALSAMKPKCGESAA